MSVTLAPRARMQRERLVAGRVEEHDVPAVDRDVVRADVLRDAAGFAFGDPRFADGVEQAGLAVVDVTHDRDDRRARDDVGAHWRRRRRSGSALPRSCASAPRRRTRAPACVAVSVSSVELMVIINRFISSLPRTSLTRTSSLSARSFTVMPSASVMVRVTGGGAAGVAGAARARIARVAGSGTA